MKEPYQLSPLSEEQKAWVIDTRASGMSFEEIADHFREVFPDYGKDIPSDVFPNLFVHRLKKILDSSQSSAKFYLEGKQRGETPINVEVLPLVMPHIRLLCYQRLWDETPARTLQRVIDTADGEVKVYKENTRERLAILTEFRKELQTLGILEDKSNTHASGQEVPTKIVTGKNPWETEEDVDSE